MTMENISAPAIGILQSLRSPGQLIEFLGLFSQNATLLAGVIILLSGIRYFLGFSKQDRFYLRNDAGKHITVLPQDTRTLRFSNGADISAQGNALAGDEPYMIINADHNDLVLVTPEHLREFMAKDGKDHTKPHGGGLGDYAWRLLGRCVGQQSGEKWKTMRSHFDPEFSHQKAVQAEPVFHKHIQEWMGSLTITQTTSTFVLDALTICRAVSFRLLAIMSYGEVMNEETFERLNDLTNLHRHIMGTLVFNTRVMSKLYNLFPTKQMRQLDTFNRLWKQFNLDVIHRARKEGLDCPVERIFAGVEQGDMDLQEFLQSLDEMLYTNIDITGLVVACLLAKIAANPEVQARLRTEISAEKKARGFSASTYATKQETLLNYVTLEAIRLNPALHFSPASCTAEDKTIGGYRIPAKTTCVADCWRINTHRGSWGADAETFRPERFANLPPASYRFSFIRWGVGSNRCMGKNMAELLLKMTAMEVLERYELRVPAAKMEAVEDQDTITNKLQGGIEFVRL
ncbi:cytochrome P450 CYP5293A1 [Podospora appendiculata]|uniref:Cytochrome P450 CYP5293A1 n=1 Tax=Podospora appendiculata TaxID=314037 RepID=A0AAE0XGZ1_9PEZI|nr:cytochrome P450 CYP5293A1 [Podospora appendiculata]